MINMFNLLPPKLAIPLFASASEDEEKHRYLLSLFREGAKEMIMYYSDQKIGTYEAVYKYFETVLLPLIATNSPERIEDLDTEGDYDLFKQRHPKAAEQFTTNTYFTTRKYYGIVKHGENTLKLECTIGANRYPPLTAKATLAKLGYAVWNDGFAIKSEIPMLEARPTYYIRPSNVCDDAEGFAKLFLEGVTLFRRDIYNLKAKYFKLFKLNEVDLQDIQEIGKIQEIIQEILQIKKTILEDLEYIQQVLSSL